MSTPEPTSLLEQRIAHEREWAYALWLERHSFQQIRQIAQLDPAAGGLGYDLSLQAIKGLVAGAKDERGDLSMSREARIERQVAEVDERARAARHDFGAAYQRMATLDDAIAGFVVYDVSDAITLRGMVADRAQLAADLERADSRLDRIQAREAKLLGLDAPTESKVDVTTHDGTLDDLNAALARLGKAPVAVES